MLTFAITLLILVLIFVSWMFYTLRIELKAMWADFKNMGTEIFLNPNVEFRLGNQQQQFTDATVELKGKARAIATVDDIDKVWIEWWNFKSAYSYRNDCKIVLANVEEIIKRREFIVANTKQLSKVG